MSRTGRELVAKVLNMFKNFMRIFSPKYFTRLSREFTMRNFRDTRTNVARRSRDILEKTCEYLATIWRENKTKRHSYECRATLARMSRDCRTN